MRIEQIVTNQIAVTHMKEMVDKLDEIKSIIPSKYEGDIILIKDQLEDLTSEIVRETLPEWMKWLKTEEPK